MATPTAKRIDPNTLNLKEQVVSINRVTKVVKGGKNLSFSALVVIGDSSAKVVGLGVGKAKDRQRGGKQLEAHTLLLGVHLILTPHRLCSHAQRRLEIDEEPRQGFGSWHG